MACTAEGVAGTGNIEYDAIFECAMRDLEITEELREKLQALLSQRDQHHKEIMLIQSQWALIAESKGKPDADQWLASQPFLASKVQQLLQSIQTIDQQIGLEKEMAAKKKLDVAQEIAKAPTLISSLLEKIPNIKLLCIDVKQKKRRIYGFRHLSSYRALSESIKELFPSCKYELTWNENVIDSEDSFIIVLEEHTEKANIQEDYNLSTIVLEVELLDEKAEDEEDSNVNDKSTCSSSEDESISYPIEQHETGRWTPAEKIRLQEGLRRFKSDYKSVANFVGTRTNKQVSNFLIKHPSYNNSKKRPRSNSIMDENVHAEKIAKWLDNSSIVANRITTNNNMKNFEEESSTDEEY
jgi:hypothetical protein